MSSRTLYTSMNSFFVSSYKLFGFVTLAIILFGLIAYVAVSVFYLLNESWIAPVILSPSHQKVLELNAQLAQQKYQRDKLAAEKLAVLAELESLERTVRASQALEERVRATAVDDLVARRRELGKLGALLEEYKKARVEIASQSTEYAGLNKDRVTQDFEARLIDRDAYVNGRFQSARAEQMSLTLREQEVRLEEQVRALARQVSALNALHDGASEGRGLTRETLALEQELSRLRLETEYAQGRVAPLRKQIEVIDATLRSYDELLGATTASPYLRAFDSRVTLAFVPYEHLDAVRQGTPLYGCELGLVWCPRVGTVKGILDGEVSAKHPFHRREMRGVMAEIHLDDARWGEEAALHAGKAPFWL